MSNPITPEQLAVSGSEDANQTALFAWAANPAVRELYPDLKWMLAIPNGGYRDKRTASRLKATGVKKGVPDILLAVRRGLWAGLWIELKRPKQADGRREGTLTKEQSIWMDHLQSQGYGVMKCIGWDEAREAIVNYLNWKGGEWK